MITDHQVRSEQPQPPRRGLRRAVLGLVSLVVVGLVASLSFVLLRGGTPLDDAALAGPDAPRATAEPARIGVFLGAEPERFAPYEAWLGRPVDYVVMFAGRDTWADIVYPEEFFKAWWQTQYRMVFSLPMLPLEDASIRRGAAGEYDPYFRTLGEQFVKAGLGDTIFRVGWEFNLADSRWATGDTEAWKAYYRRIVAALRSVPGQDFEFDWNPNNGGAKYDAVEYYPGDDVVDYVGIDAYDNSWARGTYPYPPNCDPACRAERQRRAWSEAIYGGDRGLQFWSRFASRRGKPMSLPEWGLWDRLDERGGGENVYYLQQMKAFIDDPSNGVAYQAYFEFDGADGTHRLMTTFPESGQYYRTAFGTP